MHDTTKHALFMSACKASDKDAWIADHDSSPCWAAEGNPSKKKRNAIMEDVWAAAHISIREIRKHLGITQAAFSLRFCIPKRTIEQWEEGTRSAPPYLLLLLAESAGLTKI